MNTPLVDRLKEAKREWQVSNTFELASIVQQLIDAAFTAGYVKGHEHGCGDGKRVTEVREAERSGR